MTVFAGVDAETAVIVKLTPAEIATVSSPKAVDPLIPIRETKTRVLAVAEVFVTVIVPEESVAVPMRPLVPSVSCKPLAAALQIRLPVVAAKSPVANAMPPVPFGVTVKVMLELDPVIDRALPARRLDTVAAPVVRFVTEGVRDPPSESQVADPEEFAVRA